MLYATALKYYRTGLAIAKTLNIKPQAVYAWGRTGIVPVRRAVELQGITKGALKVDSHVYARNTDRSGLNADA
jgi:hypothetical protein